MTTTRRSRRTPRRVDAIGVFAGDRLIDLLSRRQLIRTLTRRENAPAAEAYAPAEEGTAAGAGAR